MYFLVYDLRQWALISRAAETLIHQTPLVGMYIGNTVGCICHEYLPALCTGVVLPCNKSPQSYGFNKTVTQFCRSEDKHNVARLSAQEIGRLKWKVLGGLSPHLGALGGNQCPSSFSLWAKSRSLRLRAEVLLPCRLSAEGPLTPRGHSQSLGGDPVSSASNNAASMPCASDLQLVPVLLEETAFKAACVRRLGPCGYLPIRNPIWFPYDRHGLLWAISVFHISCHYWEIPVLDTPPNRNAYICSPKYSTRLLMEALLVLAKI